MCWKVVYLVFQKAGNLFSWCRFVLKWHARLEDKLPIAVALVALDFWNQVVGARIERLLIAAGKLEDAAEDALDQDFLPPEGAERLSMEPEEECSDKAEVEMNQATADALKENRKPDGLNGKTRKEKKREKEKKKKKRRKLANGHGHETCTDQDESSTGRDPQDPSNGAKRKEKGHQCGFRIGSAKEDGLKMTRNEGENGKLVTALLDFVELTGKRSGIRMAQVLYEALKVQGLQYKRLTILDTSRVAPTTALEDSNDLPELVPVDDKDKDQRNHVPYQEVIPMSIVATSNGMEAVLDGYKATEGEFGRAVDPEEAAATSLIWEANGDLGTAIQHVPFLSIATLKLGLWLKTHGDSLRLGSVNWKAIELVATWLEEFAEVTALISSTSDVTISSVILLFAGLFEKLEKVMATLPLRTLQPVKDGLRKAHQKLVLDPRHGLATFEDPRYSFESYLVENAKDLLKTKFNKECGDLTSISTAAPSKELQNVLQSISHKAEAWRTYREKGSDSHHGHGSHPRSVLETLTQAPTPRGWSARSGR
ncbi:hypothetical protein BT69DRAFT_1305633 [Atractiella rhizophila]|nr:hypothetical protein BT69DRAFT_1305633 [Atractiella rhizophila]